MQFIVHPEIFDRFPGLNLPVAVAHDIDNQAGRPQVEEDWRERHFVWRQARTALITESTRSVFLVSEVLGESGRGVAEKVLNDLSAGLQAYFGVTPSAFLVDERHPSISW